MPAAVREKLNQIQRKFFWGDTEDKRRMHLISWEAITQPKCRGRLGVPDIETTNSALLAKWTFRYGNESNCLWRIILNGKNGWNHKSLFPIMENPNACSKLWRNTSSFLINDDQNSKKLKDGFGVFLGEGDRILFWSQAWLDGIILRQCFPRIFSLAVKKEGYVCEFGFWEGELWKWKIDLRRDLFGWEVEQWSAFNTALNHNFPKKGKMDRLIWKPNNNGVFSVQSAKNELRVATQDTEKIWRKVWVGVAPPKVEIFIWQLIKERIPVRKLLLDRGIIEDENARCVLCNTKIESCFHLFFECSSTWKIWMSICRKWGVCWTAPGTVKKAFLSWFDFKVDANLQVIWRMLFFASCWSIWLYRNAMIFEGKNIGGKMVRDLILIRSCHWFNAKVPLSNVTVREALEDPKALVTIPKMKVDALSRWTKPEAGSVKFNVDAAVNENSGNAGIGGILRDAEGRTKAIFSKPINLMRVEDAEFRAIVEAFSIFDSSDLCNTGLKLTIESDSAIACQWCLDASRIPWRLQNLASDFEILKQRHKGTSFCKVPRRINETADNLAKAGTTRTHPLVIFL